MRQLELKLRLGTVTAAVSPGRGAIVTSLRVNGRELLYLDRATFDNPTQNVRGGIPLLFPFAGSLQDGNLSASNTKIPQHGFARNHAWDVIEQSDATLRLQLASNEETFSLFPWKLRLEHTFLLTEHGLHQELRIENLDQRPMPVSPGWHPYFNCATESKSLVQGNIAATEAGRVHDNAEVNYGVIPPAHGIVEYNVPGIEDVRLTFSPEMRHLQIWSIPGKPFVCIEPFAGPPNMINTPDTHLVMPSQARTYWMRIESIHPVGEHV